MKSPANHTPDFRRFLHWRSDNSYITGSTNFLTVPTLSESLAHGFVLHTGPHRLSLGDRLTLLPLDALWTPVGAPRESRGA